MKYGIGKADYFHQHFEIRWLGTGKPASCSPDPAYPEGINVDVTAGRQPSCLVQLPYPAESIGSWLVHCWECGLRVSLTAAGRPDDPKSIKLPCRKSN